MFRYKELYCQIIICAIAVLATGCATKVNETDDMPKKHSVINTTQNKEYSYCGTNSLMEKQFLEGKRYLLSRMTEEMTQICEMLLDPKCSDMQKMDAKTKLIYNYKLLQILCDENNNRSESKPNSAR